MHQYDAGQRVGGADFRWGSFLTSTYGVGCRARARSVQVVHRDRGDAPNPTYIFRFGCLIHVM